MTPERDCEVLRPQITKRNERFERSNKTLKCADGLIGDSTFVVSKFREDEKAQLKHGGGDDGLWPSPS